jgi:hypothetical protein
LGGEIGAPRAAGGGVLQGILFAQGLKSQLTGANPLNIYIGITKSIKKVFQYTI